MLRVINRFISDSMRYATGSNELRSYSCSTLYPESLRHLNLKQVCSVAHVFGKARSLLGRVLHVISAILLSIVSFVTFIVLRILRPTFGSQSEKLPLTPGEEWAQRKIPILANHENAVAWLNEGLELGYWQQPLFMHGLQGNVLHMLAMRKGTHLLIKHVLSPQIIDLSQKDQFGNTPLVWAIANASNTNAFIIIEQTDQESSLNVLCAKGNTALHLSVGKGYVNRSADREVLDYTNFEITQALLNKKTDPNRQNQDGNTPLHLACLRRDAQSIKALLNANANPNLENKAGNTPAQMIDLGYSEAKKILEDTVHFFLLDESEYCANRDASLQLMSQL